MSGLSGSKLNALNARPIQPNQLEFEPLFFHFQSSEYWDNNGTLGEFSLNGDSIRWVTGLTYRITYGIADRAELGVSYSNDLLLATVGAKYLLSDNDKLGIALMGGFVFPMGNKTVRRSVRFSNTIAKTGGGIILTSNLSPDLAIDVNMDYYRFIKKSIDEGKDNLFFNADIGHYFHKRQLQVIFGMSWQQSRFENISRKVLTVHPGFTVETGENFVIVVNGSFDVKGTNAFRNNGFSLALTIVLQ